MIALKRLRVQVRPALHFSPELGDNLLFKAVLSRSAKIWQALLSMSSYHVWCRLSIHRHKVNTAPHIGQMWVKPLTAGIILAWPRSINIRIATIRLLLELLVQTSRGTITAFAFLFENSASPFLPSKFAFLFVIRCHHPLPLPSVL